MNRPLISVTESSSGDDINVLTYVIAIAIVLVLVIEAILFWKRII